MRCRDARSAVDCCRRRRGASALHGWGKRLPGSHRRRKSVSCGFTFAMESPQGKIEWAISPGSVLMLNEALTNPLIKEHSGELLLIAMTALLLCSLLIAIPQVLRATMRKAELLHLERLKSIEKGIAATI